MPTAWVRTRLRANAVQMIGSSGQRKGASKWIAGLVVPLMVNGINFMDGTSASPAGQGQGISQLASCGPLSRPDGSRGLSHVSDAIGDVLRPLAGNREGDRSGAERSEHRSGSSPDGTFSLRKGANVDANAEVLTLEGVTLRKQAQRKRAQNELIAWLGTQGRRGEIAGKLDRCASWLVYHQMLAGPEQGKCKLAAANFCELHRMCVSCAHYRAAKFLRIYVPKVEAAIAAGHKPMMATWTQRTGDDLRERLDRLKAALRTVRERRTHSRAKSQRGKYSAYASVAGGLVQIEIKRGQGSEQWHVHGHGLLLCDGWFDYRAATAEWGKILGYHAQCDFHEIELREGESVGDAMCEVIKYQLKLDAMDPADVWHAHNTVKFRECLVSSYGILRGKVDTETDYCEEPSGDVPYLELIYRWVNGNYQREYSADRWAEFNAWNGEE